MIVRYHYQFFGRVQQVGFRFHAQNYAQFHHCTGWVKNCFDGSVEMEIQGDISDIQQVVAKLHKTRYIIIDHFQQIECSVVDETHFDIKAY